MRRLRTSSAFVVTTVVTLALGIAAITAMFSIYSKAVLYPVDVPHPETLLSLYAVNYKLNFVPPALSWPRFEAIRESATVFTHTGAYSNESLTLSGADDRPPEPLRALRVSGNFFAAIGANPAAGRLFTPADDLPNGPAVCVLSNEFWQSRFAGRNLTGTMIPLNGKPTEVIGVLAKRLPGPWADRQILLPRVFEDSALNAQSVQNGSTFLGVIGRLRPGATLQDARLQIQSISSDYKVRFAGRSDASSDTEVRTITDTIVGNRRPVFLALLGAVCVVLLISCANASALFLSDLASRERETAVRQALGASRLRIVSELVSESLAIAGVAGLAGVAGAFAIVRIAGSVLAPDLPVGLDLTVDPPALLAAVAAVLVCALLVGLIPALYATRPSHSSPLASFVRGGSEGSATRRFRSSLVVIEVSLSVLLLVGTTLLVASLNRLLNTSPGFEPAGLAAGFVNLPAERYGTPDRQAAYFMEVVEQLKQSPQVSGAAVVFGLPFHNENSASTYSISGRPILAPADRARAGLRIVSEDYFEVMRMRLVAGRGFTSADRAGTRAVCIVNESLARRQFGRAEGALGQVIRRGREADQLFEIVGVVSDVKTNGLRLPTPDETFYSFRQLPRSPAAIVARTSKGEPAQLGSLFQAAASAVDPKEPIAGFGSMEQRLADTLGVERVMSGVTAVFAALALLLSAVGLYAVLAHSVATRTAEIGIRMAIGAERGSVVGLILSQGIRLVGAGILVGLAAAAAGARLLASQLYQVNAWDPWVYSLVAVVFAVVGIAASLAPAVRASRVDPLTALRG